jgi:hypothetical protein
MKISPGAPMFKLFPQLQKTDAEREEHIEALKKLFEDEQDHRLFEHFYSTLTILDTKSSSLLVFNGILIAVFVVFVPTSLPWLDWVLLISGMAFILASSVLLLLVVLVRWTSTPDLQKGTKPYSNRLLRVRNSRTRKYIWAWYCSFAAMVCLCCIFGLKQFRGEPSPIESSRSAAAKP